MEEIFSIQTIAYKEIIMTKLDFFFFIKKTRASPMLFKKYIILIWTMTHGIFINWKKEKKRGSFKLNLSKTKKKNLKGPRKIK